MINEDKYKGLYRIPPARWRDWDYGANAAYFVTICTAHRVHYFGEITDSGVQTPNLGVSTGDMTFTEIGQKAHDYWTQIPEHFPFVTLGAFVIMPNHVHGVIVIDKPDGAPPVSAVPLRVARADMLTPQNDGDAGNCNCNCRDAINRVSTAAATTAGGITGDKNPMLYDNLSRIIRWYKGRVTFESRRCTHCRDAINRVSTITFAWQTRFNDRVIRNYDELARIEKYIDTNISNWHDDELYN
jgi:REP element-mobilizing transposase RayT